MKMFIIISLYFFFLGLEDWNYYFIKPTGKSRVIQLKGKMQPNKARENLEAEESGKCTLSSVSKLCIIARKYASTNF